MNTNLITRIAVLIALPTTLLSYVVGQNLEFYPGSNRITNFLGVYFFTDILGEGYALPDTISTFLLVLGRYALLVGFVFALIPSKKQQPIIVAQNTEIPPGIVDRPTPGIG
jgi:hypothetical protein